MNNLKRNGRVMKIFGILVAYAENTYAEKSCYPRSVRAEQARPGHSRTAQQTWADIAGSQPTNRACHLNHLEARDGTGVPVLREALACERRLGRQHVGVARTSRREPGQRGCPVGAGQTHHPAAR